MTIKFTNLRKEPIEVIFTPKAKEHVNPLILPEVQEQMKEELQDEKFLQSFGKVIFYCHMQKLNYEIRRT